MKSISLFLAYFLKYGGIVGVLFFLFEIAVINSVGEGYPDGQLFSLIFYITVSLALFFIGNIWSKKLLR